MKTKLVLLLGILLFAACSSDEPSGDRARLTSEAPTSARDATSPTNVMKHGFRANYLFTDNLDFQSVTLLDMDGETVVTTHNKLLVDSIVQSISGAEDTAAIDMSFPLNHFDVYVVVQLAHSNPKLDVTLHYDQCFVDPQDPTPGAMCWITENDALTPFIQKHIPQKDAG